MTQAISDPKQASAALAELFETHSHVVFFGGAGVSTASGIPDFRSVDGLYHQRFSYPPETMLSHSFYEAHPAEFFDFYRTKMIALGAKPNHCHAKLAELERTGKLDAVVTRVLTGAVAAIAASDALVVGGTSLVVYPAAGLTRYFTGDALAICNLAPTDQDANADLLISCDIAAAFAF